MQLATLLEAVPNGSRVVGERTVEITGVTHDSRAVKPGSLFCCLRGAVTDGHDFASAAVDAGAAALLCDRELPSMSVPQAVVPSTREAIGLVSAAFYGYPSRRLEVVGVTGTSGKTTTVHLLRSVFDAAGRRAAVIGTLTGTRTTPEAPELQAGLRSFVDGGTDSVAMEVSSHALGMHRVDGTWFDVAVFTNLSRDHLDFHGSMASYFQAKARLFSREFCGHAAVNLDDPYGRLLRDAATVPTEGFSLSEVSDLRVALTENQFRWRDVEIQVPLGGRMNAVNAVAAATAASHLGIRPEAIATGIGNAGAVPGRFEPIDIGQPFRVIVDYAHKPDGLEHVLSTARELAGEGRVLVVFGCGGERDPSKRPYMGQVAVRMADVVIVTSDNPRSEDPKSIIADILEGASAPTPPTVEPDRRAAIARSLDEASPGDIVVIAGKGHETTQIIGGDAIPFDDRAVVRQELESQGW